MRKYIKDPEGLPPPMIEEVDKAESSQDFTESIENVLRILIFAKQTYLTLSYNQDTSVEDGQQPCPLVPIF
jgi:hypothetical protein